MCSGLLLERCSFVFLSDNADQADLWLLNSCTVKNPSEDNFRNSIKKAKESGKHLILAGCVGQGQPGHESLRGLSIIGVSTVCHTRNGKTTLALTCPNLLFLGTTN